jgi:hypothetical protein
VTHEPPNPAVRRTARVLALVPAIIVTTAAGAAWASPPDSWENTPNVSPLHVLLLLAIIPLGLFVLITLLVMLPSMKQGGSYSPSTVWRGEPQWFGGPTSGLDGVDRGDRGDGPASAGSSTTGSEHGGASGRW